MARAQRARPAVGGCELRCGSESAGPPVLSRQGARAAGDAPRARPQRPSCALRVWKGVGAYHHAVGDAPGRFITAESAVRFCASRQVPTEEDLQSLATQAGFADVEVRLHEINIHLPRLDEF